VVADEEVVITQPTAGEFKVFTAVCTHNGCLVAEVSDTINCPCHQSTFDLATGEPTGGPAPSALDAVDFEISGDQVVLS
jgi:Rieske Fe-S protein